MTAIIRRALDGEILLPGATIRVVGRAHPLAGRRVERRLPSGLSIAEILDEVLAPEPDKCGANGARYSGGFVVYLGDHPVLPENYRRIRVKAGTTVTFFPRLQGGDATVWRTVLSAVIAIAAVIVAVPTGGLSLAVAGTLGVSAATASALIGGSIILAGTLLLNALFPIRPPASQAAASSLNSIRGAQNQANPFGAIPVVLGRHRQSPVYASKPYTEIVGDDQYLRVHFCLGYGPLLIEALQIGETPLASYSDFTLEVRQGFAGDPAITIAVLEVDEQQLSVTLKDPHDSAGVTAGGIGGDWSDSVFTAVGTDEISVDFAAPIGINATDSKGKDISWPVRADMRYRPVGTAIWAPFLTVIMFRTFSPTRAGIFASVATGQYEVQTRKATGDGNDQFTRDTVVWSALRSIKHAAPLTFPRPLAQVALRIKATDQLSGVIDTLNCITTSLVTAYSGAGGVWHINTASQWPPDLFRWVLQGPANARPVADAGIDIGNLQDWWSYCVANGFKFNQVIQQAGSVYDKLCDIAAAGRAVPTFIDGKWGVIWDRPDDPIVQHFTPRNSWGFRGQRAYAQAPHGWRVSFINETNGFTTDEIRVYDDGFDAGNATLFEAIQFPGVTDPALNWKHGRFQIAQSRLRPEKISLSAGWETLICTRGDRVKVTHPVLLIGLASGRVKSVAGQVVTVDEQVTIEGGKSYGVTFRVPGDARSVTCAVDPATAAGDYTALTLVGDLSLLDPDGGDVFAFGETNLESAVYRVQGIAQQASLVAVLTLVDDAPAISQADQGAIPAYVPNITIPPDPFTLPPRDLRYLEVIDGQGETARALVRLVWQLPRLGKVASFTVQARDDDVAGQWRNVDSVPVPRMTTDVPLTSAGTWSFRVQCVFNDGTVSAWVEIISVLLLGLLRPPAAVSNLRNAYVSGRSFLSWDQDVDPRTVLVEIRKGASFAAAQVISDAAGSPWQTVGDDTYFVTPYVVSPFGVRIYATTQSLALSGTVAVDNIIVDRDERATGWTGTFSGYVGIDQGNNFLRTAGNDDYLNRASFLDTGNFLDGDGTVQAGGTYWSADIVDTGGVSFCRISNDWTATGVSENDDFLGNADFLGNLDELKASLAAFVRVRPVIRISMVGPVPTWGPTQVWSPDVYKGWMFQLGMQFEILDTTQNAIAYLLSWAWSIDVPDRLDSYQDLTIPIGGTTITFQPTNAGVAMPFNGGLNDEALPHVTPSIQSPNAGDLVVWSALSLSSVTIQVKNAGVDVGGSHVNILARGY